MSPAGICRAAGVEVGETFLEALRRELVEEGRIELTGRAGAARPVLQRPRLPPRPRRGLHRQAIPAGPPAGAQSRDRGVRVLRRRRAAGGDDQGHAPADRRSARRRSADRDVALGTAHASSRSAQIPSAGGDQAKMKFLKILCAIGFLVVLVSNIWSISGWIEARGVYDDICYLRQAHLFERFGLRGIDTNIAFDDDHYLTGRLKAIDFPEWNDVQANSLPHLDSAMPTNTSCNIRRGPASCWRCFPLDFRLSRSTYWRRSSPSAFH